MMSLCDPWGPYSFGDGRRRQDPGTRAQARLEVVISQVQVMEPPEQRRAGQDFHPVRSQSDASQREPPRVGRGAGK